MSRCLDFRVFQPLGFYCAQYPVLYRSDQFLSWWKSLWLYWSQWNQAYESCSEACMFLACWAAWKHHVFSQTAGELVSWKGEMKIMTMRRQSCLLSPVLISVLPLLINAKWKNTVHIRKGLCKRPCFKQDCSLALYYLLNSLGESSGFANSCWREHVPS